MKNLEKLKESLNQVVKGDYSIKAVKPYESGTQESSYEFYVDIKCKNEKDPKKFHRYSFQANSESDDIFIFEINDKEDLLEFCKIFLPNFNPLMAIRNIFHELAFLFQFCESKKFPIESIPHNETENIYNFYHDRNYYVFGVMSKDNKLRINLNFHLNTLTHEVIPEINMYSDFDHDLSLNMYCPNTSDYEEFKDALVNNASRKLNKKIEDLQLSDYRLLEFVNI